MARSSTFSIAWQRQRQPEGTSAHSLLISLLRGVAALQVAAAHLRAEMFPGMRELATPPLTYQMLAFATGFAHQAVVVFFLISGWLVGGSLLDKLGEGRPAPLRNYAIDRITRLWTVLAPALLAMLAIGVLTGEVDPGRPDAGLDNAYSASAFAGNLLGLQTVVVENFGGNYALWSLANETWYYIAFPLLLLVFVRGNALRQIGAATALVLMAGALPLPITMYFALWLLGALFSRLRVECGHLLRAGLMAVAVVTSVYFRIKGSNDDLKPESFVQDVLYSVPLLLFLASMQYSFPLLTPARRFIGKAAHWLSEFSFTLYVTHVPAIKLLRYLGREHFGTDRLHPAAPLDYAIYAGMLVALMALAYLSYRLFEAHTFRVRRLLKSAWARRNPGATLAPRFK
jgi:peptidoglycan/LPS O-acetylase OafA/YrhL